LRTWLLGIARYRSIDALRTSQRETRRVTAEGDLLARFADEAHDPDVSVKIARAKSALEVCLERCISAEERSLILLHYRDGLSYEAMSVMLGRKADTLRARAARALVKLRRGLET
jgi:RNA polymerase sigma factor (sigma-70 family)